MLGISAANGAARFADAEELLLLISHARVRRGVQNAAAKLKERISREPGTRLASDLFSNTLRGAMGVTKEAAQRCAKVALSDFRSLSLGRLRIPTPYASAELFTFTQAIQGLPGFQAARPPPLARAFAPRSPALLTRSTAPCWSCPRPARPALAPCRGIWRSSAP